MSSLLIKNVNIIDPNSDFNNSKKDILLKNGLIVKVGDKINDDNSEIIQEDNLHVWSTAATYDVTYTPLFYLGK